MAAICLITPSQLSTNPRLVKEADALTEAGHDVSVICTRMVAWANETDREFAGRRWTVRACIPLGAFERPLPRVYRAARRRVARKAYDGGLTAQRVVESAWHEVTPELIRAAREVPADLYIAHYPAALPAAAQAARSRGVVYAYDAEDFHLGDPPDSPAFDAVRSLTRRIEGRYLGGAAYVTAASPGIADAYVAEYGIPRPTVLLNVFPRANAPECATSRGSATPGPSIYWFSQTIGKDRGLECAVRAIALAQSRPHLYVRGRMAAGFDGTIRSLCEECGVLDRLHILAPGAPSSLERLAANYDVGLASETGDTPNHRIALANKIFTYLLGGIPVLLSDIQSHEVLANMLGDVARVFRREDPPALAHAIDSLLLDTDEAIAHRRRRSWELGQNQFNWDQHKHGLLDAVVLALPKQRAAAPAMSGPP